MRALASSRSRASRACGNQPSQKGAFRYVQTYHPSLQGGLRISLPRAPPPSLSLCLSLYLPCTLDPSSHSPGLRPSLYKKIRICVGMLHTYVHTYVYTYPTLWILYHIHSTIIFTPLSYSPLYHIHSSIIFTPLSNSPLYHIHPSIIFTPLSYSPLYHIHLGFIPLRRQRLQLFLQFAHTRRLAHHRERRGPEEQPSPRGRRRRI